MLIKTKLSLGTGFLFIVIVIFGVLSMATISRLKVDAGKILQNNYESLVYSNNMLVALDKLSDTSNVSIFQQNLKAQQNNITEVGEDSVTSLVSRNFFLLKTILENDSLKMIIRGGLHQINQINQNALFRKNRIAAATSQNVISWLVFIFSVLILITFTIAVNFPAIISGPVKKLSEGITAIVEKDYSKRIHIEQNDEFGALARAFNGMAEKLDEYEHSNLAEIKFEKSRIETIINQMTDGIIGLDDKRNILFLNVVSQKLLGLKQEDIAGRYAPDVAISNDLMRTLMQNEGKSKELKIFADNRESYFHTDHLTVTANDKMIGEVIIMRNITPYHELNEAKTNFLATVSHELKTPIAAIKISAQLLSDPRVGESNTEQKDLVKSINDDANRLLKITSELLNMTQLETGQVQLKIESVPCSEIIEEAIHSVQFIMQQNGITITQEIQNPLPRLLADAEKTSWVLINFLTNAIKHSPVAAKIILSVDANANHIRFRVKDFGKGMEEKYLARIFERYYKIPGRLSASGSGLGLTIAKEFIEAQGGRVWVESKLGKGSTFGFELPAAGS
ncbi:MAG: ATP-binding protein [Flavitalea sp.]